MSGAQILVVNAGSSSVKFSLVDPESGRHLNKGGVDRLGTEEAVLEWSCGEEQQRESLGAADLNQAMEIILQRLRECMGVDWIPDAVGHRMVHGAEAFKTPTRIGAAVLEGLEACNPMAPLHNPANLTGIRAALNLFPDTPQVAVMDTAFHQTMPPKAFLYAIPYRLYEDSGIRRYGFHGTSHQYVCEKASERLGLEGRGALISAHLGNGCSAAAVLDGKSVDTTMGLTPLEGLVMGTRSGDVDPSLHQFLADNLNMSLDEVTAMLNRESGLLGLSGLSNDMRELLAHADQGHSGAQIAIDVFCYRLAKSLASLVVPLGRLDALIFTGGIGTWSAPIRERVVSQLGMLGLTLDPEKNLDHGRSSAGQISLERNPAVLVIPTDEEMMIARETWKTVKTGAS